jgi:hypothetical protein
MGGSAWAGLRWVVLCVLFFGVVVVPVVLWRLAPPVVFWTALGSGPAAFALGLFAEPLKAWFWGPDLKPDFQLDHEHIAHADDMFEIVKEEGQPDRDRHIGHGLWIRVSVKNGGRTHAGGCVPFATNVEKLDGNKWCKAPEFVDPLQLKWSAYHEGDGYAARDLPVGVRFFIDVFNTLQTGEDASDALTFHGRPGIPRVTRLFQQQEKYRITVHITGQSIAAVSVGLITHWQGHWKIDCEPVPRAPAPVRDFISGLLCQRCIWADVAAALAGVAAALIAATLAACVIFE